MNKSSQRHKIISIFLLFCVFIANAQNSKNKDTIAKKYSDKAWDYYYKQNDSAIFFADKGIAYSKQNKSTYGEMINTEVKAVYLEVLKSDYKSAAKNYFIAVEIAEKHHTNYLSSLYNNLCIMYMQTNDFNKSIIYGKKAILSSKEGSRSRTKALVNYGIAQSRIGNFKASNKTLNQYLTDKNLTLYEKSIAHVRMAKNYREQGEFKKAQPLFLKVIAPDSLKGKRKYNLYYAELINNYIKLEDKKGILKYLDILEKSFSNDKNLKRKQAFYITMTDANNYIGDYKKALEYQDQLLIINDTLNKRRYRKGVVEVETKYQTKKKEEQLKIEKKRRIFWLYLSMFAVLISLIVAILLYKNGQKRKLLKQSKLDLETALNQRNMLLKETHHRVKNSFQMVSSLLQLQAHGSKAEGAVLALENAVQRVNSMIVLHQQLYAKDDLLGIDLKIYIDDLIKEILLSYQSEHIKVNLNIIPVIVNIDIATSIGLLINELATNSIKYAWKNNNEEKLLHIFISNKNYQIDFKMYDNGTVHKDAKQKSGYGTELINILIDRLDAIKSNDLDNDFAIHITIPINNEE
jgi:two-component sensor histidine kinase